MGKPKRIMKKNSWIHGSSSSFHRKIDTLSGVPKKLIIVPFGQKKLWNGESKTTKKWNNKSCDTE